MATRSALVTEAGRRLGDQSTAFLADVDAAFDWTINDMAAREAISSLRQTANFSTVANQENYSTLTMTGFSAPNFPLFIDKIWVSIWGTDGLIEQARSDLDYERFRAGSFESRGMFRFWRLYPNESQIQFWPPVDADHVGTNIGQVTFVAAPTVLSGNDDATQIRSIFQETVIWGLMARTCEQKDETQTSFDAYWQLYLDGVARMAGHRFNHAGGRIPIDFESTY